MELNKNGRNFLLGILFKSYLVQTAGCSLIIWVCTDVMDVAVSQIFRKCFGDYFFMYYRSLYTYMAGFAGWVICVIYLTYRLLKKVVSYVYELQEATGKLFDKSTDYIELSPELSEIAANINALKQEAEENARLAKESQQYKSDQIMYLAHDLKPHFPLWWAICLFCRMILSFQKTFGKNIFPLPEVRLNGWKI